MQPRSAYSGHKQPVVQDYDPNPAAPYISKPRSSSQADYDRRLRTSLLPQGVSVSAAVTAWPKGRRPTWVQRSTLLRVVGLLLVFGLGYGFLSPERLEEGRVGHRGAELSPSEIAQGETQVLAAQRQGVPQPRVAWQEDLRELPQRRIPRIIHQTYKIAEPPVETLEYMQSWRDINKGYQFHFYDDESCLEFVRSEFPEYFNAYVGLPKNVERSDFFRYMVLLRHGGVYADIDTECRIPVDDIVSDSDTLVVGWENEWATPAIAFNHHYVRRRQVLQWVLIAAPGHPVLREICDFVAANVGTTFSNNTNRDTLERTGPGAWTDMVLKHAMRPDPQWPVRILPRVAFGVNPKDRADAVNPDNPNIAVLHHFLGSWKVKGGWKRAQSFTETLVSFATRSLVATEAEEAVKDSATVFPVSALWEPPFTVFVNLVGQGQLSAGEDISNELTIWGTHQPGTAPTRKPSVVEALAGALSSQRARGGAFVDIGAGLGYFSLAAAARGHKVVAIELTPGNLDLFRQSIEYNSYQDRITLHPKALGAVPETICVSRGGIGEAVQAKQITSGYAAADTHHVDGDSCSKTAERVTLDKLLDPKQAENIGVIRIDANGWEGEIIKGMSGILRKSPPAAILLQYHPSLIPGTGYLEHPANVLQQLYDLGYQQISHSGTACDERWHNITRSVRARGSYLWSSDAQEALKQPTWCRLNPDSFHTVAERAHRTLPENILFTHTGLKLPSTGGKSSDMGSDTAPAAAAAGGVLLRGATGQSTVLGRKGAGVAPAI